jgi:putative transposase
VHVRFGERTRETDGSNAARRPRPTQPIIKLLDGTKLFLHGVIDNYSRRLLAWELATKLDPTTACRVLEAAGQHLTGDAPTVACDSGVENVNGKVDTLIDTGRVRRVLALVEVSYANSMTEAWWRNLKNSWLYLHTLASPAAVEKLVAFYVEQHNTVMPCRAFNDRTPDEVYSERRPTWRKSWRCGGVWPEQTGWSPTAPCRARCANR